MDYKSIWNEICFHIKKSNTASERDFQTVVEFLFEKLGWSIFKSEIVPQAVIPVGSVNSVKPDILIKKEGKVVFVVELKKPNVFVSERNVEQLKSYMRLLKTDFGILFSNTLQVYYERPNDSEPPIIAQEIPFVSDSQEGIEFIEYISKDGFSLEKFRKYCVDIISINEQQKKAFEYIRYLCSNEGISFVTNTLKKRLEDEFSVELASLITSMININISKKNEDVHLSKTQTTGSYHNSDSTLVHGKDINISKSEAIRLCEENGVSISGYVTISSRNRSSGRYWANPHVRCLLDNWTLLLNDNINNKLHVFHIPSNSIEKRQVKMRNDVLVDLQIEHNNKMFLDQRSKLDYSKWFIQTISY